MLLLDGACFFEFFGYNAPEWCVTDVSKNETEINKFLKNNIWMFNNEYVFFSENNRINPQNILDLVELKNYQ